MVRIMFIQPKLDKSFKPDGEMVCRSKSTENISSISKVTVLISKNSEFPDKMTRICKQIRFHKH